MHLVAFLGLVSNCLNEVSGYLAVVLDWFSRRVLSWRVSITMEAAFCVETLEDALARHGKPDIGLAPVSWRVAGLGSGYLV